MKNNFGLLTCCAFLLFSSVSAQQKKLLQLPNFDKKVIHWGFYLGVNHRDFKVNYTENAPKTSFRFENNIGFHVGLIGDLRINDNLNLRLEPGLSSNSSTLYFEDFDSTGVFNNNTSTEISSTYLHLPLLLKVSGKRWNNSKPYLIGGASLDYNFDSNSKNPNDNANGEFRMEANRLSYEIGFGVDFYFHYFKFSPSIRGQFAATNELVPDDNPASPWTAPIDFMGSKAWFMRLTFE
jgi:hypothetical protein